MPTKQDHHDKNDYIWKVILPECFIRVYMLHFGLKKKEAEDRLMNTPEHDENDDLVWIGAPSELDI